MKQNFIFQADFCDSNGNQELVCIWILKLCFKSLMNKISMSYAGGTIDSNRYVASWQHLEICNQKKFVHFGFLPDNIAAISAAAKTVRKSEYIFYCFFAFQITKMGYDLRSSLNLLSAMILRSCYRKVPAKTATTATTQATQRLDKIEHITIWEISSVEPALQK